MANTYRKLFSPAWTGAFANSSVIYETDSGKTITVRKPLFDDNLAYIERQRRQQAAMQTAAVRDAVTYANFAQTQEVYQHKAQGTGVTAYTLAIADWFCGPRVLEINVDGWTGQLGQTIRVKARDNMKVAGVSVVIRDAQGKVLEMGEAHPSQAGGPWWTYTTTALIPMTPLPTVQATAHDLPGNSDSFTIH